MTTTKLVVIGSEIGRSSRNSLSAYDPPPSLSIPASVQYEPSKRVPKVVGPPLTFPSAAGTSDNKNAIRVDESGQIRGVCPPGNPPLKDGAGKLVLCNGLEPNCPPKSYCFVTGIASEHMYNCCSAF